MYEDMEPFDLMAKFIYEVATADKGAAPSWRDLPDSRKWFWLKTTAAAWEVYWTARESREGRLP